MWSVSFGGFGCGEDEIVEIENNFGSQREGFEHPWTIVEQVRGVELDIVIGVSVDGQNGDDLVECCAMIGCYYAWSIIFTRWLLKLLCFME